MKRPFGLVVFGLMLLLSGAAAAGPVAPLNCRAATQPVEIEICRQGYLMALDQQMVTAYFNLRGLLQPMDQKALDVSQLAWQQDRSRCGANIPCIRALYARRMDELANWH